MRVFLSYASDQRAIAEPVALSLRGRDHTVFFDKNDLPPGGNYEERIKAAVRASDAFVFLISPDQVCSGKVAEPEKSRVARHDPTDTE
jgi:hypothetical protein